VDLRDYSISPHSLWVPRIASFESENELIYYSGMISDQEYFSKEVFCLNDDPDSFCEFYENRDIP